MRGRGALTLEKAFAYAVPAVWDDAEATPLLCAGIIGYRALRRSQVARGGTLALYGFGSSAHVTLQIARHWGCQVFGRHMASVAEGGSILSIASVTAHLPLSRVFAYSASKAAVVNLTQNVARELAPHGVRVNALCPGFFPAEQNRKILDAERVTNIMAQTPMARFGEPQELIGTALLLLSRQAGSFITGAAYYVDGGFTAMRF